MRKFQFSFQKILDLKEKNREQEEWNYARLLQLLSEEKNKLLHFSNSKQEQQKIMLDEQINGVSIIEINQKQLYVNYLDQSINNQKEKIKNVERSIKKKQIELLDLKIDEKKWNKLKEKKFEEFSLKSNQIEQNELDEIANKLLFR